MLSNLYRKLYLFFAGSVMLIITFVIAFAVINSVSADRLNESAMFQRMTTMLIYQLEHTETDLENTIRSYEEKYSLSVLINNSDGETIYQSASSFPRQAELLLKNILKQTGQQKVIRVKSGDPSTYQGGIYEVAGTKQDRYYAIPATIAASDENEYQALFVYQKKDLTLVLKKLLPPYLLAWILSLGVVVVVTHSLLKKAFFPTEQMWKSQRDFVANASHELKSPLAVMVANSDILLEDKSLNAATRQAAEIIGSECMRLSRLVKDMLLLASSDAKTWSLHPSQVDVDLLLITLYETYEQTCMRNGLQLHLELSEDTYPVMDTDRDRLQQILCILLDNAIQHSKDNPKIEIQAVYSEKQISFSIIDHGQGISDVDKKYVFDRFYSGDSSHTDKFHFGLGLSIAKELTRMLNGTIRVSDTDGGGATFTVCFPLNLNKYHFYN